MKNNNNIEINAYVGIYNDNISQINQKYLTTNKFEQLKYNSCNKGVTITTLNSFLKMGEKTIKDFPKVVIITDLIEDLRKKYSYTEITKRISDSKENKLHISTIFYDYSRQEEITSLLKMLDKFRPLNHNFIENLLLDLLSGKNGKSSITFLPNKFIQKYQFDELKEEIINNPVSLSDNSINFIMCDDLIEINLFEFDKIFILEIDQIDFITYKPYDELTLSNVPFILNNSKSDVNFSITQVLKFTDYSIKIWEQQ